MKGVKDEEKPLDHMFPRLHINDTDKSGPKAPPRNKMSLYEKLSVPSQRLTTGSSIPLPLPRNDRGNLVPSTSAASRGSDGGKCLDTNISSSAAYSRPTERLHPYYSGGAIMSIVPKNVEFPTAVLPKFHAPPAAGYYSMLTNSSFPQAHATSSSQKKIGDEVSIRVPSFCMDKAKLPKSSSHWLLQTAPISQLKQTSKGDIVSSKVARSPIEGHMNRPGPVLANRDKLFLDASLSVGTRNKVPEFGKKEISSAVEEKRNSLVNDSGRLPESNAQVCHEFKPFHDKTVQIDSITADPNSNAGKRKRFDLEAISCSSPSPDDCQISSNKLDGATKHEEDKKIDISETSMVDSISGGDINPDDIIGVIGRQQFWRIRRALLHQQRTFALQLFELHRIVKVQRLIASSPQVLLGTNAGKPLKQVLPVDKLLPENVPEPPNFTTLLTLQKPLPSLNSDKKSEPKTHKSNFIPYLSNPPTPATTADKKPPLCFLPAPGNQWLVPVMSPSEGLIYKPYTGPCPPTSSSSSMANPAPTNPTNPTGTDLPNRSYSVTASNQQGIGIFLGTPFGHTYVSPYGMPVMNLSNAKENHLTLDVNFSKPSQSSFNMTSTMNTPCVGNSPALRESERRASADTSPERKEGDVALPLFPTTPTAKNTENQSKVIKVVPHNARAAPESAARIFESIKEGRR